MYTIGFRPVDSKFSSNTEHEMKRRVALEQSMLCFPGSVQIWYHLQTGKKPDVFTPTPSNLADGRLHRIRIHRVGKNLYVQVSDTGTGSAA